MQNLLSSGNAIPETFSVMMNRKGVEFLLRYYFKIIPLSIWVYLELGITNHMWMFVEPIDEVCIFRRGMG